MCILFNVRKEETADYLPNRHLSFSLMTTIILFRAVTV